MPRRPSIGSGEASDIEARARIVAAARRHFFSVGYSALTMDDLSAELGMSKKTLYRHFASKDAVIGEVLDLFASEVRAMAEAVFSDESLSFTARLHRFSDAMVRRFASIQPHVMRDLERYAPQISRKIEELRYRNIPHVFGRIFRQGQEAGMVRDDIDAAFAVEFWRAAIQGMMQPATLERLGITTDQAFGRAIDLFFAGFLTNAGRKDYDKYVAP
jgi:AcrR family transcriptional regulator